jgi:putative Ca2+/H+ antiporter (TMEM165/GDT1 family)
VLNHALAVLVGNYITRFESAQAWIQGIAALSFVFFGLWTIRGDQLEGEENRITKFGPIVTVAFAFFLAEMGDKTQLTTIALAARFPSNPIGILMGTTTGMLIADGIGIFVGVVMCKKIPERVIKLVSAGAFILFGFIGSFQVAQESLNLSTAGIIIAMGLLAVITGLCAYYLVKKNKLEKRDRPLDSMYCKTKKRTSILKKT